MRGRGTCHDGHTEETVTRLVATCTRNRRHRRVVHGRSGEGCEIRRRMTAFTGGGADRNVLRWRAGGLHPVVATRASRRDTVMPEDRTRPADR